MLVFQEWHEIASAALSILIKQPLDKLLEMSLVFPKGPQDRPDLQGLRAIAVLLVIAFHAGAPLPGGFVGVDIFFVISGFVITLSILRSVTPSGKVPIREFLIRRFRRLFPTLVLVVTATLLISGLVLFPLDPLRDTSITALASVLSVANVVLPLVSGDYFDDTTLINPLLHTWSLSVEGQFYLLFPLILAISLWLNRRRVLSLSIFAWLIGVLSALTLMVITIGSMQSDYVLDSLLWGFYSPLGRFWEFGVGILLAIWSQRDKIKMGRFSSISFALVGFGLITYSAVFAGNAADFPNATTILPVAGAGAVIAAGFGKTTGSHFLLGSTPMQWIGDRSYSLYLWHWPIITLLNIAFGNSWVTTVIAIALSFLLSHLTYQFVEFPGRNLHFTSLKATAGFGFRWSLTLIMTSVVTIFVPLITIAGDFAEALKRPIGYEICHNDPNENPKPRWCSYETTLSNQKGSPVYLVGDSNAAQFASGLLAPTNNLGQDLFISTASNCPMVIGYQPAAGKSDAAQGCALWQEKVLEQLRNFPSGTVVLSWSDEAIVSKTSWIVVNGTNPTQSPAAKGQIFTRALLATLTDLLEAHDRVILVQSIPQWRNDYKWSLIHCSLFEAVDGCAKEAPLTVLQQESENLRRLISDVGQQSQSQVVDFGPVICPNGTCSTWNGSSYLYRDGSHISVMTSESLADEWRRILVDQ